MRFQSSPQHSFQITTMSTHSGKLTLLTTKDTRETLDVRALQQKKKIITNFMQFFCFGRGGLASSKLLPINLCFPSYKSILGFLLLEQTCGVSPELFGIASVQSFLFDSDNMNSICHWEVGRGIFNYLMRQCHSQSSHFNL